MLREKRHPQRRRLLGVRACIVLLWAVLGWASVAPAAHAVGLPFVDLPSATSMASDAMDAASKAIVNLIASSVASLTNEIIKVSDTVAAPQVGSSNAWFTASYKRTMGVSLYLMAIASLIAITAAGVRGKVGDIAQVVLVGIPSSVVAMMLATLGVQLSLALTDAMTAYTFASSVDDIQTFLHDIGTVFTATDNDAGAGAVLAPGLVLIIGLLLIVAQLVILAVLIVRTALIYIVTLFLPLVLAMQVWPATRHMTRKALELLAVLILSKFAIFTCFALGAGATRDLLSGGAGGGAASVQTAIVGFGVMAAAAFSPMLLMSIVPGIAGSFGAGMPGGSYGAGALAVKSPSQIMRSTLSGIHTVRSGTSTHTNRHGSNNGNGSGGGASTLRPPTPPSGSAAGGSERSGASAAHEQAHTARAQSTHPAAGGATPGASVLASGAQTAARTTANPSAAAASTTQRSPQPSSTTPTPTPSGVTASERAESAPHIVSDRDAQRPTSSSGSASGGGSTAQAADSPARSRGVQQQPPRAEASRSVDGFSPVSTRQPFTLETT